MTRTIDLVIENPGLAGFFVISAQSPRGKRWLRRNVPSAEDGATYSDDREYAWDIYQGAAKGWAEGGRQ